MKQRLRLCLLAAAMVCAVPPPAPAQLKSLRIPPRVSHVPIEGGVSPDLADQYLKSRLDYAETAELQRLLTDLAQHPEKAGINDPKDRKALADALREADGRPEKLLDDQRVKKIIREAAGKLDKRNDITPEERRRWEDLASRYFPPSEPPVDPRKPGEANVNPGDPPSRPPDGPEKPPDGSKPADGSKPPNGAVRPPSVPPPVPTPPPSPPANSPMNEHLRDLAEWAADSRLADSPAFRRMVANLDRVKTPEVPGGRNWDRRLEQMERRFATLGTRLPRMSWPKVDFSARDPADRMRPAPANATGTTGGGGEVVFLLLAAAAVALLVWAVFRRPGLVLLRRGDDGWRLGPWPVRPEAVRTRDELVRAFEYLALLLLGPAARTRNHEEIAAGLGEQDVSRRAAAERLAGLYEQARYAPPDEVLPDTDLAAARADLSLLAGVAAA